jgi:hypothetical protein
MDNKRRGTPVLSILKSGDQSNNWDETRQPPNKKNIKNLVDNINKDLDNYSVNNTVDTDSEKEIEPKAGAGRSIYLPYVVKEILLVAVIYLILEQKPVQNFITGYFQYVSSETITGTFLLGLIFGLLFVIIRKIENVI